MRLEDNFSRTGHQTDAWECSKISDGPEIQEPRKAVQDKREDGDCIDRDLGYEAQEVRRLIYRFARIIRARNDRRDNVSVCHGACVREIQTEIDIGCELRYEKDRHDEIHHAALLDPCEDKVQDYCYRKDREC